jgi:hypothetical protein
LSTALANQLGQLLVGHVRNLFARELVGALERNAAFVLIGKDSL